MTVYARLLEIEDTLDAAIVRISRIERRLHTYGIVEPQASMNFDQCGLCGVFVSPVHGYWSCTLANCPGRAQPA